MQTLRRTWAALGWIGLCALVVLSLIPQPPAPPMHHGDKLEHFLAYGALMWWFAQIVVAARSRPWLAAGLAVLGCALEFAQGMTSWRSYSHADMGANTVGVALGWLLAPPRTRNVLTLLGRRFASATR